MSIVVSEFAEKSSNANISSNRINGIRHAFVCLFLLGTLPIITNGRPDQLDAINFAFYLSLWQLISSLPLFTTELKSGNPGILARHVSSSVKQKTLVIIILTGIIFSITTFLYVLAFQNAGTINAAIALQAYPLFSLLLEAAILRSMKSKKEIAFTVILVSMIFYLGTLGTMRLENFSLWFGIALFVPLLWSIAHITIRQTISNSPITPNQITLTRVLISSFILGIISIVVNGFDSIIQGLLNPRFQVFALLMGLFYYLELVNWFYAIKDIEVSTASSITTPNPVITMILAIILLGESVESYQLLAMVGVFVSLYGLLYFGRKQSDAV